MYGMFTYMYHKNQPNVGKIYHTWMVWDPFQGEFPPWFSGSRGLNHRKVWGGGSCLLACRIDFPSHGYLEDMEQKGQVVKCVYIYNYIKIQ